MYPNYERVWSMPDGRSGVPLGFHQEILPKKGLLLICRNKLERECLKSSLIANGFNLPILDYDTIASAVNITHEVEAVLINIGAKRLSETTFSDELETLAQLLSPNPLIVLSEHEDWPHIAFTLELGVKGYIPASVDIAVCIHALNLVIAGGRYVPVEASLNALSRYAPDQEVNELFTARELQVIRAMLKGKANKIISFELGMTEGTVKAHIHHIMRKIGATNRTQVVCKLHHLRNNDA